MCVCVCVCVCVQNYGEQLLAQILGALIIISIGLAGSFVVYLALYLVPIQPTVWLLNKYVCMYVCIMYVSQQDTVFCLISIREEQLPKWASFSKQYFFTRKCDHGIIDTLTTKALRVPIIFSEIF